jgi:hypothetical protein
MYSQQAWSSWGTPWASFNHHALLSWYQNSRQFSRKFRFRFVALCFCSNSEFRRLDKPGTVLNICVDHADLESCIPWRERLNTHTASVFHICVGRHRPHRSFRWKDHDIQSGLYRARAAQNALFVRNFPYLYVCDTECVMYVCMRACMHLWNVFCMCVRACMHTARLGPFHLILCGWGNAAIVRPETETDNTHTHQTSPQQDDRPSIRRCIHSHCIFKQDTYTHSLSLSHPSCEHSHRVYLNKIHTHTHTHTLSLSQPSCEHSHYIFKQDTYTYTQSLAHTHTTIMQAFNTTNEPASRAVFTVAAHLNKTHIYTHIQHINAHTHIRRAFDTTTEPATHIWTRHTHTRIFDA